MTLSKRPLSVANSVSTYDSFSQFKVLSRATIEVSQDEEFVFGVNLLHEVMQVAGEGLLYFLVCTHLGQWETCPGFGVLWT